MTPGRMAKLVARWVRFYTRDLPTPIARRRTDEIGADLHDHIAHERGHGTSDRRIALGILSRMVRGIAADASWRGQALKTHKTFYRSAVGVVRVTALMLLAPLLAMQLTGEVAWSPADFAVAGALLMGTGLAYQVATRMARDAAYRVAVGVALAAALMLVWLMGAVGIVGVEGDPADLMYFGVLAVGIVGTIIARLRPEGMARALIAMALAQGAGRRARADRRKAPGTDQAPSLRSSG
jgi:hypothetical protein